MENSYTNKNNNLANYNNLMNFNGFYTNVYRDPFVTGFAFIFVTKPLLFIDPSKPTSEKNYKEKMAYINMTRDPVFVQFLETERMNKMDLNLVKMLSYNEYYSNTNFLPIFTNEFKSFDANDVSMEQTDAFDTKQGYRLPMPTNKTTSEASNTLSISVTEDANLDFTKLMTLWVNYIQNISDGVFDANPDMVMNGVLDYTSSIYYFVLEPDGKTLKYWAKYTGCWPTSIPFGGLKYAKSSKEVMDIDLSFNYAVKEDMNPKILEDFNRVSLNVEYGKIQPEDTNTYYTPLRNSPLLNEEKMANDEYIGTALNLAKSNPDRAPLVFLRNSNSDGTDQAYKFELSFGENAYRSQLLDEILNRDTTENELSASGFWYTK